MAFYRCGGGDSSTGNATEADVLYPKTFSNSDGVNKQGSMPNNGTWGGRLDTTTASLQVPRGYHSGSGYVGLITEEKSVTLQRDNDIEVKPSTGKVLSKVNVPRVSDRLQAKTQRADCEQRIVVSADDNMLGLSQVTILPPKHDEDAQPGFSDLVNKQYFDMGEYHYYKRVDMTTIKHTCFNRGILGAKAVFVNRWTKNGSSWGDPINFTPTWQGAMILVQTCYDSSHYAYATTIYPMNYEAEHAEPNEYFAPSPSPNHRIIKPISTFIHGSTSEPDKSQIWFMSIFDIDATMNFKIIPDETSSQLTLFKVVSQFSVD